MSLKRKTLGVVIAAMLAGPAWGADGILDVYRIAQENDPTLRATAAERRAIGQDREQAQGALLPQLNLQGGITYTDQDTTSVFSNSSVIRDFSLSLTQQINRNDLNAVRDQAELRIKQADFNYSAAELDLIIRVIQAYTGILAARDNLSFARADKSAIARQLDQTRQRYDVGLIAITDVNEAQAAFDLAFAQEIAAQNSLALAFEDLRAITGQPIDEIKVLKGEIPLPSPDPANIDEWVDVALAQNPNVLAAKSAVAVAKQEVVVQRAGDDLDIDFVVNHNRRYGTSVVSDPITTSFGVQFNVPLSTGGSIDAGVRAAEFRVDQAFEQRESASRDTTRQTRNAYLSVINSIGRVNALAQALKSAKSALEAVEAGFEVGTRTIVDVLDAQRDVFSARRDLSAERYNYIVNMLALRQAAGTLTEDDLVIYDGYLIDPALEKELYGSDYSAELSRDKPADENN